MVSLRVIFEMLVFLQILLLLIQLVGAIPDALAAWKKIKELIGRLPRAIRHSEAQEVKRELDELSSLYQQHKETLRGLDYIDSGIDAITTRLEKKVHEWEQKKVRRL